MTETTAPSERWKMPQAANRSHSLFVPLNTVWSSSTILTRPPSSIVQVSERHMIALPMACPASFVSAGCSSR